MITVKQLLSEASTELPDNTTYIHLTEETNIYFDRYAEQVVSATREGDSLILVFEGGHRLEIAHYFDFATSTEHLFFLEDAAAVGSVGAGWIAGLFGVGLAGFVLAGGSDNSGDEGSPSPTLTATISTDGLELMGKTSPGATVTATLPNGSTVTAVADGNGDYSIPLSPALGDGEAVSVTATDDGGTSAATDTNAPDLAAPAAPTATVAGDGTAVTGATEPGATVTATLPNGSTVTAVADGNGDYSIPLSPALGDGEAVSVTATDDGGTSAATDTNAPDLAAPAAPTGLDTTFDASGNLVVNGTAKEGSTVAITFPDGSTVTATAGAGGAFSITSDTPQEDDGHQISATASDGGGTSGAVTDTASDVSGTVDGTTAGDSFALGGTDAGGTDDVTAGADEIHTYEGNDTVIADEGADTVLGGLGDDNISGGLGNDLLEGGAGDDMLFGNFDGDSVAGGNADDDQIFGGAGEDTIDGGAGNDTIDGGTEADRITGSAGDDSLTGGDGADTFVFPNPNNEEGGGNGLDRISDFTLGDFASGAGDALDLTGLIGGTVDGVDITVTSDGTHTTIAVDVDGAGGANTMTDVVVLEGVDTDLATLLGNSQIIT